MKENVLELFIDGNVDNPTYFTVKKIINAGYTGRNQEEVRRHVEELKEMNIPAPEKVPIFYPKASALLTIENCCEVVDKDSTGEAEYVLLIGENEIFVGVGSDHTDRKLEASSIIKAKQLCPNFVSRGVWRFNDVKEHWDEIKLLSWIDKNRTALYQKATLNAIMHPEELMIRVRDLLGGTLEAGTVIFSGTVGALISGMPFSEFFDMELIDERRNQILHCHYEIKVMDELK